MDAHRIFSSFSKQQQEQFQQLVNTFFKQGKSEGSVNLTNISPFDHFEPRYEKFSNYLERFENYYSLKGLIEKDSIAQLLCVLIGPIHYNALSAFLGPEKPIKT